MAATAPVLTATSAPIFTPTANVKVTAGTATVIGTVQGAPGDVLTAALVKDADIPSGSTTSVQYSASDLALLHQTQAGLAATQTAIAVANSNGIPLTQAQINADIAGADAISAGVVGQVV